MRTLLFMLFVTTVETQISTTKDTPQLRSVLPSKASEDAGIQVPEAFLLYANHKDIRRVSLDTNNDSLIPLVGVKEAYALDFNVQEMQIYWTDTSLRSINRAFLNGSQIEHLIVVDLPHPDGLAVDWIAKNLYWTDSKHQRIEVARLNGQHRKMLIWRDLWKPRELTVNPVSGHMYWANGGREPTIERADLDGSNRRLIVNVTRPTGLTIDYSLGLIFWVDIENQVIECANLDGTNRRVVASGLPMPFALTQYKDYIYWTDHALNSIYRANKTNGLDQTRIKSHTDDITDILVFHSSRQEGWNSCARHNGGCSHLCLAKPGKRMVCSCPTHYTLSSTDIKTCNAPRVFMLFSTTTDIRRILFNSSDNLEVVLPVRGLTDVRAIDYDVNSHLIYWIDSAAKEIRRAFQNGSNAKSIVRGEDSSPYDLAIDSYGQQLFWTDSVKNSINVYSLRKGVSMGVVFHERDVHPRSIVLYPEKGQMFFTNEKPEKKSIVRATMAGAHKLTLFSAASPGDLAVDKARNRLYWTDTTMKRIEYADLTGMNRATLIETNVLQPVGLAVHGSYVYWIDRESRNVMKIREDDVRGRTVQAAIDDLSDMIVVDTLNTSAPKTCDPEQFTCSNGQCIPQGWICDDSEDCNDGSDEQNCPKCPKDEVRCDGGKCISVTKLCDGNTDCEDGSDEEQDNCPIKCANDEFRCATACITKDWVCDNHDDCGDGADERGCDVITEKCLEGEMRCDGGKCINVTKLCDGISDCEDLSDEEQDKCLPTKVKKTSSWVNVGLAVGICFGILILITCLIVGKLWYRRSRHAKKGNYRNITDEVIVNVPAVSLLEGVSRSKTTTV